MTIYAIGDIHGHLDKLRRAHDLIEEDMAGSGETMSTIVHLGDLADRGPDTRGVIDHLIACREAGMNMVTILGNHDLIMREFLHLGRYHDPRRPQVNWLSSAAGGRETLASYGVAVAAGQGAAEIHRRAIAAVPESHIAFLDSLATPYCEGDCLFVHAGIRPGRPIADQEQDDLVWIRSEFLEDGRDHGRLIVHGHTPVDRATHYGNRVNLDSGAGFGRALSAVAIEGREVWLLTPQGRVALRPEPG